MQLLGAMSACAPKQLGACLPQIVPKLSETLTDTHPKVVDAANAALAAVGDVIRNPEIRGLSKYLLGAISAPAERTAPCLDVLLEMTFVNTVDAPSLALIVPVLSRGLRDRSADLKKKAAKIAGNMCSLVADAKDMSPYVPILLPDIQKSLVDVSPEVRATAAAALASLLQGMGGAEAEQFSEVILGSPGHCRATGLPPSARAPRRVWRSASPCSGRRPSRRCSPRFSRGARTSRRTCARATSRCFGSYRSRSARRSRRTSRRRSPRCSPGWRTSASRSATPRWARGASSWRSSRTAAPAWTCCCPRSRRRWATRTGASA